MMSERHGGDAASRAQRLGRLVDRQHALFTELHGLSCAQSALIERGDAEPLLSLLGRRQGLVDEIVRIGEDLEPLRSSWEESLGALTEEARASLVEKVADLQRISGEVAERDERDRIMLEQKRDALVRDLRDVSRSRGAVTAYGPSAQDHQPRYQDRRG